MNRRDFTKKTLLTGCSILTGSFSITSCKSTKNILGTIQSTNSILVYLDQIADHNKVIIKNPDREAPILLYKRNDNWEATLMECTHIQCELSLKKDLLICPCHGSTFTMEGNVLNGPAKINLSRLHIRLTDKFLEISYN